MAIKLTNNWRLTMGPLSRMFFVSVSACFLAISANSVFAYEHHYNATWDTYQHWQVLDVGYWINETGCSNCNVSFSDLESEVDSAYYTWDNVSPTTIDFHYEGTTPNEDGGDGKNVIFWYPGPRGSTTISIIWYKDCAPSTGRCTDVDILMNDGKTWAIDTLVWADTIFDIRSVVTHEVGHLIGINHTDTWEGCPTMLLDWEDERCLSEGESPTLGMRDLSQDDIDAIKFLYIPFSAPTNLTWIKYQGHPKLSWNASAEHSQYPYQVYKGGYNIYRNISGCGPTCGSYSLIATVNSETTTYVDTQVDVTKFGPNDAYYYIKAMNPAERESPKSNTVSVPTDQVEKRLVEETSTSIPVKYALPQNNPNPFNPVTTIKYDLPEWSYVEMKIYDLVGREIRTLVNGNKGAGYKSAMWDGTDSHGNPVSSGMYLYRIDVLSYETDKEFHLTRKMVLLR